MSATRSQTIPAWSRRTMCAALGLALVVAAAPFLGSASAAQPTGDAVATAETAAVTGANATANDPAVWVNPTDPAKSLILGANDTRLEVYNVSGAVVAQPAGFPAGTVAKAVTGVDVRHGFSLGGQPVDVAAVVGNGIIHFYEINPDTGQLTDESATPGGITPEWPSGGGKFDSVCMYQSAVSGTTHTYAFVSAPTGQMEQLELVESAGKIDASIVRGGKTAPWDVSSAASSPPGGCVADDELHTLYVSEKSVGIWKFGAEPGDAITGASLIDHPGSGGNLLPKTQGLAIAKTGAGAGYLIASSFDLETAPITDQFMVYDRATNAYIRTFKVNSGTAADACQQSIGIDAATGNFGAGFTNGVFVCRDQHNTGGAAAPQNYKMVPIEQIVDMAGPAVTTTTTAPVTTPTTAPAVQVPNRSGYWMVGNDGRVYNFGDARAYGDATLPAGAQAVDLEPTPSGNGYWIVDDFGHVFAKGDAKGLGDVDRSLLAPAEVVTSISSTKSGNGYWVFTSLGRVIPFGDAVFLGDMSKTKLNGPVLDSIPSSSGNGYYMVAADGGIFTFGDAVFKGSMGNRPLNKPVQSLVPDADGTGYWLVASDGGIFAFDAEFHGSMGAIKLNKPVTGMVRFGNGYLMVGEDGGIFSFSDKPFLGSLGANPPAHPITSVAVLDAPAAAQ